MSKFGNIVHRIQEIDCAYLKSTTLLARKALISYPLIYFIFKNSEDSTPYKLDFIDYVAAKELRNEISKCNIILTPSSSDLRDRCPTCGKMLANLDCQICRISKIKAWKSAILSMLFPGMGQLYNQEFEKGIAIMAYTGMIAIFLMDPLMASMHRTSSVDMIGLWQLIVTLILIWLLSLTDALTFSLRNRHKKWGLIASKT